MADTQRYHIIVIGGGPAGMIAALESAKADPHLRVLLLERNEKLGKKLFITGKGRCNLTADVDAPSLIKNTVRNGRFLHSAFAQFDSAALQAYVEALGVPLKVERGARVFPVSDKAFDVTRGFEQAMRRRNNLRVRLQCRVTDIRPDSAPGGASSPIAGHTGTVLSTTSPADGVSAAGASPSETSWWRVTTEDGHTYRARCVIVATGGLAYPSTGSTGDGYALAKALGHAIVPQSPSLTGIACAESYPAALQGLSLKNVRLTLFRGDRALYRETGELLFAHYGISGPLALTSSAHMSGQPLDAFRLELDMKPGLDEQKLEARIDRDLLQDANRAWKNALPALLPGRMPEIALELLDADGAVPCHQVTRPQRQAMAHLIKHMPLTPAGLRPFEEAVITRGGVSLPEVHPAAMESKLRPGLFFAGELLDVDAFTGGFNMQIAFSTGYAAGRSAAERAKEQGLS